MLRRQTPVTIVALEPSFPNPRSANSAQRQYHLRHVNFRKGRRLGKYDHLIVWTRPDRPAWMDKKTYATIPETLELRELR